jgi:hypothetical protein
MAAAVQWQSVPTVDCGRIDHLIPQGVSRTGQALLRLPVRLVAKRSFNRSQGILMNQARPASESGGARKESAVRFEGK